MKYNCTIEIDNVKSVATFRRIVQTMLDDYEDNNSEYAERHPVTISLNDMVLKDTVK